MIINHFSYARCPLWVRIPFFNRSKKATTHKSVQSLFAGGEGPLSSFLEFFVYIDCKDDLLLHRGYKLEDLYVYNNLY